MFPSSPIDIEKTRFEAPIHSDGPALTDSGSENLAASRTKDSPLPGNGHVTAALGQHISDEDIQQYRPRFTGARLTGCLAFVAGAGFTLFGYDQGVLSALLTTESFVKTFPQTSATSGPPNHATLQSLLVAIYEIGCLIGALSNLWVGEKLGRRRTIVLGGVIMIVGAILQAASFGYAQMLVARVITGIGNGLNTSTVPAYHAECAAPEKRGFLIMIEGSLITFGIMVSYVRWIDFGFFFVRGSSAQWRAPIALQIVFALGMTLGIGFLPDSPRWLVNQGRYAEALAVISALEDKHHNHPDVQRTFLSIREAALAEHTVSEEGTPQSKLELSELLHGGRSQNFRRATLGVVIQAFQQITGINLITYYATLLFERLGIDDQKSRILAACNGTEYFLASLIAVWLIEKVGRRKLMIFGSIGQTITMILLAVLGSIDKSSANVVSAVLLFVFNSFFAVGWLGMTWLYPAEITPLRIRQPANALSTASNWAFNFMVVMVTGPSFQNIGYHTYTVFACLNAFIIPIVYFFFPETAGKSLEGENRIALYYYMDVIFAQAYNEGVSPVAVSLRKDIPSAGSPEADKILGSGIRHRNGHSNSGSSPAQVAANGSDIEKSGGN